MEKKFQKKVENFTCEKCGIKVTGTGYTDHCPNCLWSKHVDINPGDRMSECQGMMEPMGLEIRNGKKNIIYRCTKCGFKHKVKVSEKDNQQELLRISKLPY